MPREREKGDNQQRRLGVSGEVGGKLKVYDVLEVREERRKV